MAASSFRRHGAWSSAASRLSCCAMDASAAEPSKVRNPGSELSRGSHAAAAGTRPSALSCSSAQDITLFTRSCTSGGACNFGTILPFGNLKS